MDKSIKILLFIIVGLVLVNFLFTFFDNSNLKAIRNNLKEAKRSADSALAELKFAKGKLDSIKSDIVVFKAYISTIQKTVTLADAEKRVKEEKDQAKVTEIRKTINELKEALENDSLPPIGELPIRQNN